MTEKEFVEKINANKDVIYKAYNAYCSQLSEADIVQEIIIETWQSLGNFKKNCSFNTWLYRIARNKCISAFRKHVRQPRIEGLEDYAEVLVEVNNAPEMIKQLREAMRYNTVLESIEEPYRTLFQMYLEGIPYEELAQQTGVSANALRTKIFNIKKRLQLRYGKQS